MELVRFHSRNVTVSESNPGLERRKKEPVPNRVLFLRFEERMNGKRESAIDVSG